jgi:hypothetical protein
MCIPERAPRPPPLPSGHRSLLFVIAPIRVACQLVGFTRQAPITARSGSGQGPGPPGPSRCFGRAEASCARGLCECRATWPKDLETLDGSRGGLILPRRVKASLRYATLLTEAVLSGDGLMGGQHVSTPRTEPVRIVGMSIAPDQVHRSAGPLTIVAQLDPGPDQAELQWWMEQLRGRVN